MKLKLIIALVILALVFGMTFTACDDGTPPVIQEGEGQTIHDIKLLKADVDEETGILLAKDPDNTDTTTVGRIWKDKNGNIIDPPATDDDINDGDHWEYGLSDWGVTPVRIRL